MRRSPLALRACILFFASIAPTACDSTGSGGNADALHRSGRDPRGEAPSDPSEPGAMQPGDGDPLACDALQADLAECHAVAFESCGTFLEDADRCYAETALLCEQAGHDLDECHYYGRSDCEAEQAALDACAEQIAACREGESAAWACLEQCAPIEEAIRTTCVRQDSCDAVLIELDQCHQGLSESCGPGDMNGCRGPVVEECHALAHLLGECYARPESNCAGLEGLLAICVEDLEACRAPEWGANCASSCEELEILAQDVCGGVTGPADQCEHGRGSGSGGTMCENGRCDEEHNKPPCSPMDPGCPSGE